MLSITCLRHTVPCVFQYVVWASPQDDDELWSVILGPVDQEPCYRSQQRVFQRLVSAIHSPPCTRLQLFPPDRKHVLELVTHCQQTQSKRKIGVSYLMFVWFKYMNESTSEWMNERTNEWMNEQISERTSGWTNEWIKEWMNEWMN